MNILDAARLCNVTPKKAGSGEYASACPYCRAGTDRFRLWPTEGKDGKGRFWCRFCKKTGDVVQLLMDIKGLDYKTAAREAGVKVRPRSARSATGARAKKDIFAGRDYGTPAERWQSCASALMDYAAAELEKSAEKRAYLEARGIPYETARRFRLGYNPANIFTSRARWGQPDVVDGKKKKLCIPKGIVIPAFHLDGKPRLHPYRVRVRRDDPGKFPRYHMIAGGNPQVYAIAPTGLKPGFAWVVVEAELDALAIAAACGSYVGVLGLGSVAMKPPTEAMPYLTAAGVILNALDFDEAGKKAHAWWTETFPQTERWPVPDKKDPGEYFAAGGDLRAWIDEGLPPACRKDFLMPEKEPEPQDVVPSQGREDTTSCAPTPFDLFWAEYAGQISAALRGIERDDFFALAAREFPALAREADRAERAMKTHFGGDLARFKRAVIAYTNATVDMARAWKARRAREPEPQLRQEELI